MKSRSNPIQLGIAFFCLLIASSAATALVQQRETTMVDLLAQSEYILRGTIKSVSDGIDANGLPYTEVTVNVAEALRGNVGHEYKFRQFGLLKPRSMGNGMVNLMVTPAGWTTYSQGEEAILFLNRHAKYTGLQTTVGLARGKFKVSAAGTSNSVNNTGLFEHVKVEPGLLGESEQHLVNTRKGAVDTHEFVSLVRHAVKERWVEDGKMRNVGEHAR